MEEIQIYDYSVGSVQAEATVKGNEHKLNLFPS